MAKQPLYPHVPGGKRQVLPPTQWSVQDRGLASQLAETVDTLYHKADREQGHITFDFPNEKELNKRITDAVDALRDVVALLRRIVSGDGVNP